MPCAEMSQCTEWHAMCKQDPSLKFCYPGSSGAGGGDSGGGGGGTPASPGPVMKMYFFNDMPFYLLFKSWTPRTNADLLGAWFAIFCLGVLYEFLQMLYGKKESEFWAKRSARQSAAAAAAAATQRRLDEETGIPLAEGVMIEKDAGGYDPPRSTVSPTGKACCGGGGGGGGGHVPSRPDSAASYDRTGGAPYKGSRSSRRGVMGSVGAYMQPDLVAMDLVRGVARFVLAGMAYLLMLAAMCFNVAIFFAVICGVAVGSMLFGRWRWDTGVAEGYSHCGCGSS